MPLALVVDDNVAIRHMLRVTLASRGYAAEEAENGAAVLARLASPGPLPAVVILDLSMPVLDGEEVRRVRAEPAWASLPVLLCSGTDESKGRQVAAAHGASSCPSRSRSRAC